MRHLIVAASLGMLAFSTHAAKPPGVNELAAALESLAARVAKLEGQITVADLAGTYALNGLQTELGGGDQARVSIYTYLGTLTLNADGTGTYTATSAGAVVSFATPGFPRSIVGSTEGPIAFTWTYANGVLSAIGGSFSVTAGGKLLIRTSANQSDGTNVLLMLSRL